MDGKELLQELLRRYPDQRVSADPAGAGMLNGLEEYSVSRRMV